MLCRSGYPEGVPGSISRVLKLITNLAPKVRRVISEQAQCAAAAQSLPVFCDECGLQFDMPRADKRTQDALIETGYYRGFLRELELLERTGRLFAPLGFRMYATRHSSSRRCDLS